MALKENRQSLIPKSADGESFWDSDAALYDPDWHKKLETVDYTPNDSYWVVEDEVKEVTLYTKSDVKAMWCEEDPDCTVMIMTWDTDLETFVD